MALVLLGLFAGYVLVFERFPSFSGCFATLLFFAFLLFTFIHLTHEGGEVSPSQIISEYSAQVGPDVVGTVKLEQVDIANSGWIYTIAAALMAILCSFAVGYVSRGSSSSAPVTSTEIVTHDYVYRVEEHLKGCLSKLTDWSVAEINQQRKRTGEQEKKLEQLLERVVEQEKKSAGGETHAEQSVMLQCLDQRLASLERILAEAVSSGVKAGVSGSATPLLVQEKPTV